MCGRSNATRGGFSLVEVVTVVAILGLLVALVARTSSAANRQARQSDNRSRLHQSQLAVAMYQADHEGGPVMGLPSVLDVFVPIKVSGQFYGAPRSTFVSACGRHPLGKPGTFQYFPGLLEAREVEFYAEYREEGILFADHHCNDPTVDISSAYTTKHAMGVLVNGSLLSRRKQGDVETFTFWR